MATTKPTVLIPRTQDEDPTEGVPLRYMKQLEDLFNVITIPKLQATPSLANGIRGIGYTEPKEMAEMFDLLPRLPNVEAISVSGVGTDAYYAKCKSLGIPVANTPTAVTSGTANCAMALLLDAAHQITYGNQLALKEKPPRAMPRDVLIYGLANRTLGIVGMGKIGYAIARRAKAFDMKILYHNRTQRPLEEERHVGAEYCATLAAMLPQCDYVMLSCPLTAETKFLFDSAMFKLMKSSATLVNVSRGQVVDQDALFDALSTRKIHQAALDVTYPEPLPADHRLLTLPNLILTPHIAGGSLDTKDLVMSTHIQNLKAALIDGRPMPNEIKR